MFIFVSEHLILETDPEKGKGEYAFDNPGFKGELFIYILIKIKILTKEVALYLVNICI